MKTYTTEELHKIYSNYILDKGYESDIDGLSDEDIHSFITGNLSEENILKYNK